MRLGHRQEEVFFAFQVELPRGCHAVDTPERETQQRRVILVAGGTSGFAGFDKTPPFGVGQGDAVRRVYSSALMPRLACKNAVNCQICSADRERPNAGMPLILTPFSSTQ